MLGQRAIGICEKGAMRTSAVIRSQPFCVGESVRLSATATGANPPTALCIFCWKSARRRASDLVMRSTGTSGTGVIRPGSPRSES